MSDFETLVKELHELVLELREHNVHVERLIVKALDARPALAVDDTAVEEDGGQLKCSFCGKSRNAVAQLVAGTGVWICDECIGSCAAIVSEERAKPKKG